MGLLRNRGLDGTRYRLREKLVSIGDDAWIENEDGERVLRVNGKAFRRGGRSTSRRPPASGSSGSAAPPAPARDDGPRARRAARGHGAQGCDHAAARPLVHRHGGCRRAEGKGNIVDHEYAIERDGQKIAEVSKRWFRVRDTYGIEVGPGEDDALILAAAVCIDEMARA